MNWEQIAKSTDERTFPHDGRLSALPMEWEREIAALWRLQEGVFNGGYLQFLINEGRESYVFASQALKKIGAPRLAEMIDRCQSLIDEHFECDGASRRQMQDLMPNRIIDRAGNLIKEKGSSLPDSVIAELYDLSYKFMDHLDKISELGLRYYQPFINKSAGEEK